MLGAIVTLLLLVSGAFCRGPDHDSELEFDDTDEEEVLVRHKRNAGIPPNNKVNVTFEKIGRFSDSTEVGLGDKIDFKITTWWPPLTAPLSVKIELPQVNNVSSMLLCTPTISHVGNNIKFDRNLWDEKLKLSWRKNDMYQYNDADLNVVNVTQSNASIAMTDGLNDLVMSFSAVVLNKTAARGTNQPVTAGIGIGSTSVFVGIARFNYSDKTVDDWGTPSLSLKGPVDVAVDHYGVFTGSLYLPKLSSSLKIVASAAKNDAKSPLSVCELRFAQQQGASYACQPRPIQTVIVTSKKVYDQTHVLVRNGSVPLVINSMRTSENTTNEQDTLAIEFYVYFSNSTTIGTSYSIELSVQVDNNTPLVKTVTSKAKATASHTPLLNVSSIAPTFKSESGRQDIRPYDFATFVINMTTTAASEDRIKAEIFLPGNTSKPFKFWRARTLFAGRNYGCHWKRDLSVELKKLGGSPTPSYVVVDFGYLANFGFEDTTEANKLSFELVLENADPTGISNGTSVTVGVGIGHSRGAWVGHFKYSIVTAGASMFQTPAIKLIQKSPSPNNFYLYSQQVLWLEVQTKTNSIIDTFDLTMNTPVDDHIALLSICRTRVIHVGKNVAGADRLKFQYSSQRSPHHKDQLSISLTKPLVNIGRKNLTGTNTADDLLRLSFVVTSHVADVKNKSVLQSNKLFVTAKANMTASVIWAGVAQWAYIFSNYPVTGTVTFTPTFTASGPGCGRIVRFSGKMLTTIGTSKFLQFAATFPTGFERFCGIRVISRGSNVFCPAGAEQLVEVKIPNAQKYKLQTFTNVGVAGEQYTEADNTLTIEAYGQFACPTSNQNLNVFTKLSRLTATSETTEKSESKTYNYDASVSLGTGTTPIVAVFGLRNASSIEQQFGAVAEYDLYLPVNDRAFLNLSFSSPATDTSGLLICDVKVVSAGDNLPCAADHLIVKKYQVSKSDAWTSVFLDMKIMENIGSSGTTQQAANKVSIEVMFFPINGTSSGSLKAIAYFGSQVVQKTVSATVKAPNSINKLYAPTKLFRPDNRTLQIFESTVYTINITLEEGISDFNISVKAKTALSLNFTLEVLEWGDNFCCRNKSFVTLEAYPTAGNFTDKDNLKCILHLSNTAVTKRQSWRRLYNSNDDRIVLGLKVTTTDVPTSLNNSLLNFTVKIDETEYNESLTIQTSANDRPHLNMMVENLRTTGLACSHNLTLRLKVTLYFGADTHANAVNIKGVIILPFYLKLTNTSEETPIKPTLVTGAGTTSPFVFTYSRMHHTTMNVSFVAEFAMDFGLVMLVDRTSADLKLHYSLTYGREAKGSERAVATYRFPDAVITVKCSTSWPLPSLGLASGSFPADRLRSSCGGAASVRPGQAGWSCGSQPGSYIELCLGNRTRISAIRFDMGTLTSFSIRYFDNVWKTDGVVYNVTYSSGSQTLVALSTVLARRFRVVPLKGNTASYKFTMEVYGETFGNDTNSIQCEDVSSVRHPDYAPRQYLYSPKAETLFICMEPQAGTPARCLATYDKGTHWFKVDEEVANICFASNSEAFLYGIHRNLRSTVMSDDGGYTWAVLDDATFNNLKTSSSVTKGKTLPFEDWSHGTAASLASSYGLTHGSTKFSVSKDGVHVMNSGNWKLISYW